MNDDAATLISKPVESSHQAALRRFGMAEVAARYPSAYQPRGRDRREQRAIARALNHVPAGARVLDLPCGTGRLLRLLTERGYRVTAVDASRAMLDGAAGQSFDANANVTFAAADVLRLPFADCSFDAVICNRLFHHFTEATTRQRAFRELRRVCNGPLIVSFFNSFALDALKRRIRYHWRGTAPTDRVPISSAALEADARAAGLEVVQLIAVRWGISSHWYAIAQETGN